MGRRCQFCSDPDCPGCPPDFELHEDYPPAIGMHPLVRQEIRNARLREGTSS